ncbi:MAG: hypothetical protein K2G45_03130 [Lachnospiraceae bacterium]|nr:hypothetical protein [Lachnospiraceae bacterium]
MNNCPVIVKGNNTGIRIIMDETAHVELIKEELLKRFGTKKQYCESNNPIQITFEGKSLTKEDEEEIIFLLKNTGLNIQPKEEIKDTPDEEETIQDDTDGLFYIGSIKSGQSLEARESIVIIGDVEYGGSVISEGNVVVIGNINGEVLSGCSGRENTFVYGLYQEGY